MKLTPGGAARVQTKNPSVGRVLIIFGTTKSTLSSANESNVF